MTNSIFYFKVQFNLLFFIFLYALEKYSYFDVLTNIRKHMFIFDYTFNCSVLFNIAIKVNIF